MEPAVARLTGDGELILEVGIAFARPGARDGIRPARERGPRDRSAQGLGAFRRHIDLARRHRHLHVPFHGDDRRRRRRGLPALLRRRSCESARTCCSARKRTPASRRPGVRARRGSVELAEIGRAWYHHPEDLPADMDAAGLTATAGHKAHDAGVFAYSAHAAAVAVDPEVGSVEVHRLRDRRRLRHAGQSAAGGRPGHRRLLERARQCALRGEHVRRARPADRDHARGLFTRRPRPLCRMSSSSSWRRLPRSRCSE